MNDFLIGTLSLAKTPLISTPFYPNFQPQHSWPVADCGAPALFSL